LSESRNLDQNVRKDLKLYYSCSLIILYTSLLPKLNCYLFFLLRMMVSKIGIVVREEKEERLEK